MGWNPPHSCETTFVKIISKNPFITTCAGLVGWLNNPTRLLLQNTTVSCCVLPTADPIPASTPPTAVPIPASTQPTAAPIPASTPMGELYRVCSLFQGAVHLTPVPVLGAFGIHQARYIEPRASSLGWQVLITGSVPGQHLLRFKAGAPAGLPAFLIYHTRIENVITKGQLTCAMLQSLSQQFHDVVDQWRDYSERWALYVCSLLPAAPSSPAHVPPYDYSVTKAFAEPGADQCPSRTATTSSSSSSSQRAR
eukprot:gene11709-biopygen6294